MRVNSFVKKKQKRIFKVSHQYFNFLQGRVVQIEKEIIALTKYECIKHQKEIIELKCEPNWIQVIQKDGGGGGNGGVWRVIRPQTATDLPTIDRYKLSIGDVIKLGRVKLIVKDYSFFREEDVVNDELQSLSRSLDSQLVESTVVCRICLSKMSTVDNPFLSPCVCT